MRVVCISGKAQHGKDTTANILKEELELLGYRVLITHYADLLKYICKAFFGWDEKKDEAGRYLLQYVGTDVIRAKNSSYWVDFITGLLSMFPDKWDFVLIPDCRFPNEIEIMKCHFETYSVRVIRDGFQNPLTDSQRDHPSETALDDYNFDFILRNDGSLEDIHALIKSWAYRVLICRDRMKKLTILVDLDDVLWDLCEQWVKELNWLHGTKLKPEDITSWEMPKFFPQISVLEVYQPLSDPELWHGVHPIPDAQDTLKKLIADGHKIRVVTASHYETISAKFNCFLQMYPFLSWRDIVIASDKSLVSCDIMIDDGPHNLENAACKRLLFDRPHNRNYDAEGHGMVRVKTWDEIYRYIFDYAGGNE